MEMNSVDDTRLLISFLSHLKTDPVVVDKAIFSQACGAVVCFVTFTFTVIFTYRSMSFTIRRENVLFSTFFENMDRLMKEEMDPEDEVDENGNEIKVDEDNDEDNDEGNDDDNPNFDEQVNRIGFNEAPSIRN